MAVIFLNSSRKLKNFEKILDLWRYIDAILIRLVIKGHLEIKLFRLGGRSDSDWFRIILNSLLVNYVFILILR